MDRQWLYPYYVIALLALILYLFGCDSQRSSSFSVEVQIENEEETPIEGATVGLRPCYDVGRDQDVWCVGEWIYGRAERQNKAVELAGWDVRIVDGDVLLVWSTASESNNAGFEIQGKPHETGDFQKIGFVEGQGTTSESTSYRYRYSEPITQRYTFRLVAVETDGTTQVVGEPETVRPVIEPAIEPLFPNPFRSRAIFGVQVGDSSSLRSTIHTLDGAQVRTITDEAFLDAGRYQYVWSAEDLAAGVYEHRTRIRKGGAVVAGDTAYAAVAGTGALGTTDADGTVSTTDRTRFPALYDVPTMEVRDAEGRVLDTMRVSPTVEFVVTTEDERKTFRRTVSEGENTLTLTVSP